MLFKLSALLCLSSSIYGVEAQAIAPRDASSIVSSLQTVSFQLTTLNSSLTSFTTGNLILALDISEETTTLISDVADSVAAATQSGDLDDAGSSSVAFAIVSLSASIFSVLDNLVSKYSAFDETLAYSITLVENDLVQLKNNTDALGTALTSKFVPTVATLAPLVLADLDYHFIQAIRVFNSTS